MKRSPMPRRTSSLKRSTGEASLTVKVLRPKKCRGCGNRFTPARQLQVACSGACGLIVGRANAEKADRADTRARRIALRTRSDWMKLAQAAFNRFVRLRDAARGCISCGRETGCAFDAGHYLSTGARPELRFHEANVHKQCVQCNQHLHGNLVLYRAELMARVGITTVLWLEGPHEPAKLTVPQLIEIVDTYRAKARELEKGAACSTS